MNELFKMWEQAGLATGLIGSMFLGLIALSKLILWLEDLPYHWDKLKALLGRDKKLK